MAQMGRERILWLKMFSSCLANILILLVRRGFSPRGHRRLQLWDEPHPVPFPEMDLGLPSLSLSSLSRK